MLQILQRNIIVNFGSVLDHEFYVLFLQIQPYL